MGEGATYAGCRKWDEGAHVPDVFKNDDLE